MKIIFLNNKIIDKAKWDDCIKNAPNGIIYAYSWYLDTVSKNWDALIFEDYSAVFPLTWKNKFGFKYLCQPPFSQQLGLFSRNIITPDTLQAFLKEIINTNYKIIEINLNKYNKFVPVSLNPKANITYELDLIYPYENICKNFQKTPKEISIKLLQTRYIFQNISEPTS